MKQPTRNMRTQHSGFSLVEIMVGMVIGLLTTLIIVQVFSVFEAQKRTTSGLADAQVNGSIALYTIEQDLQQAGYGLAPTQNTPLACTSVNGIAVSPAAPGTDPLAPVLITDGVSDTIYIRYSSSGTGGLPIAIQSVAPTPNDATVLSNFGCEKNDRAILINGTACDIAAVSAVTAAGVNPATITLSAPVTGAEIACLNVWNDLKFEVVNNTLYRAGDPAVAEIVNIQAQYGLAANKNSNQITQWIDPGKLPASVDDRNRIKAVRVAVVARNPKKESNAITQGCSALDSANPTGLCAWAGTAASPAPAIDLSGIANWQNYRYQVFETIIPLRNVIWSKGHL
ncbi:MAG: PilW family protein [Pseudomonadota bacterium]